MKLQDYLAQVREQLDGFERYSCEYSAEEVREMEEHYDYPTWTWEFRTYCKQIHQPARNGDQQ